MPHWGAKLRPSKTVNQRVAEDSLEAGALTAAESCEAAESGETGILNGTQFNVGDKIRYRCVTGYVLDGHSLLTCITNAPAGVSVWDFPVPICRARKQPSVGEGGRRAGGRGRAAGGGRVGRRAAVRAAAAAAAAAAAVPFTPVPFTPNPWPGSRCNQMAI
ncbi:hypothetical protein CRUP_032216 [Coryphaenoides rupestris]|nr:hypothetical protein CRUP_032216 [Coryphaenoides rupestris]